MFGNIQRSHNSFNVLDQDVGGFCELCEERGSLRCSRCKTTYYCSQYCQKMDWSTHREFCLPADSRRTAVSTVPNKVEEIDQSKIRVDTRLSNVNSILLMDLQSVRILKPGKYFGKVGLIYHKGDGLSQISNIIRVRVLDTITLVNEPVDVEAVNLTRLFTLGDLVHSLDIQYELGEVIALKQKNIYKVKFLNMNGWESDIHVDKLFRAEVTGKDMSSLFIGKTRIPRVSLQPRQGDYGYWTNRQTLVEVVTVVNHEYYMVYDYHLMSLTTALPADFYIPELNFMMEEIAAKKKADELIATWYNSNNNGSTNSNNNNMKEPQQPKRTNKNNKKKKKSANVCSSEINNQNDESLPFAMMKATGGGDTENEENNGGNVPNFMQKVDSTGLPGPEDFGRVSSNPPPTPQLSPMEALRRATDQLRAVVEGWIGRLPGTDGFDSDVAVNVEDKRRARSQILLDILVSPCSVEVKTELLSKILLDHSDSVDVNVTATDKSKDTPLHIAARLGDAALIALLRRCGASLALHNASRQFPDELMASDNTLTKELRNDRKKEVVALKKKKKKTLKRAMAEAVAEQVVEVEADIEAAPGDSNLEENDQMLASEGGPAVPSDWDENPENESEGVGRTGGEEVTEDLVPAVDPRDLELLQVVESIACKCRAYKKALEARDPVPPKSTTSTTPSKQSAGAIQHQLQSSGSESYGRSSLAAAQDLNANPEHEYERRTVDDLNTVEVIDPDDLEYFGMDLNAEMLQVEEGFLGEDSLWEVEISKEARQQWLGLDRPLRTKVASKLILLAHGLWTNIARPTFGVSDNLKLYRTNFTKGGRLIWEVAISYSSRLKCYCEVIRVWAVVADHDKQESEIKNIEESHRRGKSSNALKRMRMISSGDKRTSTSSTYRDSHGNIITLPRLFEEETTANTGVSDSMDVAEVDVRKSESQLWYPPAVPSPDSYVILKFYECTQGLLHRYCAELDENINFADFPFRLSPTEHAVCDLRPKPPSSVLLLGRSGTGKTTCLGFRMWFHYKAWSEKFGDRQVNKLLSDCTQSFNQIFLTANPVLRTEVSKFFHSLLQGERGESADSAAMSTLPCGVDSPTLCSVESNKFPLFLTKREWLVLLDGTLRNPFFARIPGPDGELSPHIVNLAWGRSDHASLAGLSDCFFTLQDDDDDIDKDGDPEESLDDSRSVYSEASRMTDTIPVSLRDQPAPPKYSVEVDYDYFVREIYPHISGARKYSPSLLWCEFTSFIKGSAESLETGHLSEKQYSEVGKKRAPNFKGSRNEIYSMFLEYERLRKRAKAFDICDVVYHIFNELRLQSQTLRDSPDYDTSRKLGYTGTPIHELFVDEVQDFLESEIMVLLAVTDPNNLFLTGDDAQTIARGLAFRFSDIRSLFWGYHQEHKSVGVPEVYKLTNNYRTHSGILNLANSVIDLILHFFPGAIDKLPHDRGLFNGPKPWLLEAATFDDLCLLLLGSDRDHQIEFGANQCVIVRDTESKLSIPEELRRGGIVCSVFESKGLEFNDILLYNFFTDSPAKNMWRCVIGAIDLLPNNYSNQNQTSSDISLTGLESVDTTNDNKDRISSATPQPPVAPTTSHVRESKNRFLRALEFDSQQHKILLEEMKHLYTAITRARVNVWIYDESEEFRAPMFEFFRRKDLVRVVESVIGLSELQITKGALTSHEEWITQGRNLMDKGAFNLAHICFTKGQNEKLAMISRAHALARSQLQSLDRVGTTTKASKAVKLQDIELETELQACQRFKEAGELFLRSNLLFANDDECIAEAAACFKRGNENTIASKLYEAIGNYRFAAQCLEQGGKYFEAGNLYVNRGKYKSAARCYKKSSKEDCIRGCKSLIDVGQLALAMNILMDNKFYEDAYDVLTSKIAVGQIVKYTKDEICLLAIQECIVKNLAESTGFNWVLRVSVRSLKKLEQVLRDFKATNLSAMYLIRIKKDFHEGVCMFADKKLYDKALTCLDSLDTSDLELATVLSLRARCLYALNRIEEARLLFEQVGDANSACICRCEIWDEFRTSSDHDFDGKFDDNDYRKVKRTINDYKKEEPGYSLFWTLQSLNQKVISLSDLFVVDNSERVEDFLKLLESIATKLFKMWDKHQQALFSFFELEPTTYKPNFLRFDKLSVRFVEFLKKLIDFENETSAAYRCCPKNEVLIAVPIRMIELMLNDWKLQDILLRIIDRQLDPEVFQSYDHFVDLMAHYRSCVSISDFMSDFLNSQDKKNFSLRLVSEFNVCFEAVCTFRDKLDAAVSRQLMTVLPSHIYPPLTAPIDGCLRTIPWHEGAIILGKRLSQALQKHLVSGDGFRRLMSLSFKAMKNISVADIGDLLDEVFLISTISDLIFVSYNSRTIRDLLQNMKGRVDIDKNQFSLAMGVVSKMIEPHQIRHPFGRYIDCCSCINDFMTHRKAIRLRPRLLHKLEEMIVFGICFLGRLGTPVVIPASSAFGIIGSLDSWKAKRGISFFLDDDIFRKIKKSAWSENSPVVYGPSCLTRLIQYPQTKNQNQLFESMQKLSSIIIECVNCLEGELSLDNKSHLLHVIKLVVMFDVNMFLIHRLPVRESGTHSSDLRNIFASWMDALEIIRNKPFFSSLLREHSLATLGYYEDHSKYVEEIHNSFRSILFDDELVCLNLYSKKMVYFRKVDEVVQFYMKNNDEIRLFLETEKAKKMEAEQSQSVILIQKTYRGRIARRKLERLRRAKEQRMNLIKQQQSQENENFKSWKNCLLNEFVACISGGNMLPTEDFAKFLTANITTLDPLGCAQGLFSYVLAEQIFEFIDRATKPIHDVSMLYQKLMESYHRLCKLNDVLFSHQIDPELAIAISQALSDTDMMIWEIETWKNSFLSDYRQNVPNGYRQMNDIVLQRYGKEGVSPFQMKIANLISHLGRLEGAVQSLLASQKTPEESIRENPNKFEEDDHEESGDDADKLAEEKEFELVSSKRNRKQNSGPKGGGKASNKGAGPSGNRRFDKGRDPVRGQSRQGGAEGGRGGGNSSNGAKRTGQVSHPINNTHVKTGTANVNPSSEYGQTSRGNKDGDQGRSRDEGSGRSRGPPAAGRGSSQNR